MDQLSFDFSAPAKACSTCGIVKPLDAFTFDRRKKDGRQARCRQCHREYQKRWIEQDREHYTELRRQENTRRRDKNAAYKRANRERIAAQQKIWEESRTPEQVERSRLIHREASARYRAENPELCGERIRAWKRAHPERVIAAVEKRRVLMRTNGAWEDFTRAEIGERDGWVCGICTVAVDPSLSYPDQLSQSTDHIVPLSLGGEHTRANVRITHWICNVRRGIGMGVDWNEEATIHGGTEDPGEEGKAAPAA